MGADRGTEAPSPLPAHSVRVSRRARRVLLRVVPGKGLEVVVPPGFDVREVPGILRKHGDWIARHLQPSAAVPSMGASGLPLPEVVELRAIGLQVQVAYRADPDGSLSLLSSDPRCIEVRGDLTELMRCFRLIRGWVKNQAVRHLPGLLAGLGASTGLRYKKVQIRGQKRRWGSFSARGTISLNWKLLFLPPDLVRYLLVHELCHSVHLNHSASFWELVGRHEPQFKALDARLRKARDLVPLWADYTH